jgi:adenylate kinase
MEKVKNFDSFVNEREIPDKQGKIIVLLGPPGSGKGTLSKKLEERNGFSHISTGDLIRNSDDAELKKIIAGGKLVPDRIMARMLRRELGKLDLEKGIIIDGFPRTTKQSGMLDSILGKMGVGLNHAIYIKLNEEIAKKRILKRAEKEDREDDKDPEIVSKRFKEYTEKTSPLIDSYEKSRRLITVDGSKGSDEVYKETVKALGLKDRSNEGKKEKDS